MTLQGNKIDFEINEKDMYVLFKFLWFEDLSSINFVFTGIVESFMNVEFAWQKLHPKDGEKKQIN